jgi:hypothetical protein
MAGYSGTPLMRKIGVKPGHRVYAENAPASVLLEWPDDVVVVRRLSGRPVDVAWTFCTGRAYLARRMERLVEATTTDGMVWVSWPKKSSGVASDLDGNIVRAIGLAAGVVDVKVAAVDETWSGLKFVRRRADRDNRSEAGRAARIR